MQCLFAEHANLAKGDAKMTISEQIQKNRWTQLSLAIGLLVLSAPAMVVADQDIRSYLGNKANTDDIDSYSFMAVSGEEVWFRAAQRGDCYNSGNTLKLEIKSEIEGVEFETGNSGEAPEIGPLALPASGEYRVSVKQDKKDPLEDRYNGLYRLVSEGKDMSPTSNVESIVSVDMACHENTGVISYLGTEERNDQDTFRFYGREGETVYIDLLYSELCPAPTNNTVVDFIIRSTKKCAGRKYEEILMSGPPEGRFRVPTDGSGFASSCDYELIVKQPRLDESKDQYSGLYEINILKEDYTHTDYNLELQSLKDVEPAYTGGKMWYRDGDGDSYGVSNDFICSENPEEGYVDNHWDCDDEEPGRHLLCELKAYTNCASPYAQTCLDPVYDVTGAFDELGGLVIDKDKFKWPAGYVTPGDWNYPSHRKRHLQSIQHFNQDEVKGDNSKADYLAISMSDEHHNQANINLVKLVETGSEAKPDDHAVFQYVLSRATMQSEYNYNHPGGSQRIGEYLFLALEDFQTGSPPMIGVWKIIRTPNADPELRFIYLVDLYNKHPDLELPGYQIDNHNSTVGVTRLHDGTFLLAACIKDEGCNNIVFLKSTRTTLEGNPDFRYVDEWYRGDQYPGTSQWSECAPQNMSLVADMNGSVYLTLFGNEINGVAFCGAGDASDHIFNYRLEFPETASQFTIEFVSKRKIYTGGACDNILGIDIASTGTNFEAGSGFWINPLGNNRLSVLATEHYNSCGSGKSRWGVTGNWNWASNTH